MTTQNTALPITSTSDNIDLRVNEYFTTQFSPKGKFTDNDYELVKSFCVRRTSNDEAAASLTAAILNAVNELGLYASDVINKFENSDTKVTVPLLLNASRKGTSLLGYINDKTPPATVQQQVKT
jgi:hypothetical protein|tara:strand:- start:651 stop:1022 length:372 start_codon:yes stop_codon:yes gene_type:complete